MHRAGLIGCGGVSREHCRGWQAARNVEMVALADVSEANLRATGEAFGIEQLYTDYREMLERERLDFIDVCTQAPLHAPVTLDAVTAGVKGILCEKPIALTLEEADAMIAACERAGVRLAINHQTRMIPNTFAAERLIREGEIGELRAARMLDKGGRPAGNSLMELVTHLFDFLRVYAGDPVWASGHLTVGEPPAPAERVHDAPQRIASVDDIQYSQTAWTHDRDCGLVLGDRCSATFGFGPRGRGEWHQGMTATLESFFQLRRRGSTGGRWHPNLELIGTDGLIFLGGTSDHVDLYLHRGPWAPPGNLERVESPTREIAAGPHADAGAQSPYHVAMVEELVAAVEAGREHRSSGRDGRWALEMIMGIYESHRRGGARIDLPLKHRGHPLQRWLDDEGRPQPPRR